MFIHHTQYYARKAQTIESREKMPKGCAALARFFAKQKKRSAYILAFSQTIIPCRLCVCVCAWRAAGVQQAAG